MSCLAILLFFFFFNDTATTEIYTLSLHDALPIFGGFFFKAQSPKVLAKWYSDHLGVTLTPSDYGQDRKSTRLNSSHLVISYAVFCLKKKKKLNDAVLLQRHQTPHLH